MAPPLVVDIETEGTAHDAGSLLVVGWREVGEPHAQAALTDDVPDSVWRMIADPERAFVSHTKYDARFLALAGRNVTGPYHDTQVMAWVLNENQSLALDPLVQRYLHRKMDKRIKVRDGHVFFQTDAGRLVPLREAVADPIVCEQVLAYCCRDVDATHDLYSDLWFRLEDQEWLPYWRAEELSFTPVLLGMEGRGLPVDLEASETLRAELEPRHATMAADLLEGGGLPAGFNLNSRDQMAAFLFHKTFELAATLDLGADAVLCLKSCLGGEHEDCTVEIADLQAGGERQPGQHHIVDLLPRGFTIDNVGRTNVNGRYTLKGRGLPVGHLAPKCEAKECDCAGTHKPAVSGPALKVNRMAMLDAWVAAFLEYRRVDKLLTTYLRRFPVIAHEGRLYGRFNQTGTKTGRLSSSEPNLQNMPAHGELGAKVRELFRAQPGTLLVVGDYSQLEPRLMGHFSQDPVLLDVYRNARDIYLVTAEAIFGRQVSKESEERGIAKTLVLAMGYGAGYSKVADILTINGFPTAPDRAKEYLGDLHGLYNVFFSWREQVIARVKRTGYVETMGGRRRRLKAAFADRKNWKNIGYGERQAVNAIVQGSAGDIVRRVMCTWDTQLPAVPLLAQVHDELVAETERESANVATLYAIRMMAESMHGFALNVPLVFEPVFADTWGQKGTGVDLGDLTDDDATEGVE